MATVTDSALLTCEQLAYFRSQVAKKEEAAFLAPQLLEQVSILTAELRAAVHEIEAMHKAISELELRLASGLSAAADCPTCHHAELRSAIEAFYATIHKA